jgi:7-cyano-7-deazaguanine synthase
MPKSLVLLSSGLDSTVNLLAARRDGEVVRAVTFDYGQRAAAREIEKSRNICQRLEVPHHVVELPFFKEFTKTSLVSRLSDVPTEDVDIQSHTQSLKTAEKVWVPNRNGIFLNIAAGFAEGWGADVVVPGFNAEEATTFPDNSKAYQKALDVSFSFSTANQVRVHCYTIDMEKPEILKLGLSLGLDPEWLWPCYFGEAQWCGRCESCQRFANALRMVKETP